MLVASVAALTGSGLTGCGGSSGAEVGPAAARPVPSSTTPVRGASGIPTTVIPGPPIVVSTIVAATNGVTTHDGSEITPSTAVPATVEPTVGTPARPDSTVLAAATTTGTIAVPSPPTPATCTPTDTMLSTDSGRRILVRAANASSGSPLVLILHGYTGTPTGIERFSEFTAVANEASVVVGYPEGTPTRDDGFGWASGADVFATTGVDDVAALAAMLDLAIGTGCVDPSRVVLAGESNGAAMALAAACDPRLSGRLSAVVLVNPAVDEGVLSRCAAGAPRALPLSVVAGGIDETVPYAGGNGLLAQEEWFAAAAWLVAGCEAIAGPDAVDELTRVLSGSPCETCSVLFTVADGTHTWPGTSRGTGGLRPGSFDLASRLLWIAAAPPPTPCLPW